MALARKIISNENAIARTRKRQGYYYSLISNSGYHSHNYVAEIEVRVYTAQLAEKLGRLLDKETD